MFIEFKINLRLGYRYWTKSILTFYLLFILKLVLYQLLKYELKECKGY